MSLSLRAILGTLLMLSGCGWRPSAPPLEDGPVFSDAREGFRFLVPPGWKQRARGQVPPGKIASERMLAEYRCAVCSGPGTLLVTVADIPESTALADYLANAKLAGEKWRLIIPAVNFTINNAPAARIKYAMGSGKDEVLREIVAFRRGERVYFFKGDYGVADPKTGQAIQTAVDSVVW